jgi:hypothetical protein
LENRTWLAPPEESRAERFLKTDLARLVIELVVVC